MTSTAALFSVRQTQTLLRAQHAMVSFIRPRFDAYSQPLSRYARSRIQRSQTQLLLCCVSHVVHSCNSNLSYANLPNQPSKSLYADECVNGTPNQIKSCMIILHLKKSNNNVPFSNFTKLTPSKLIPNMQNSKH